MTSEYTYYFIGSNIYSNPFLQEIQVFESNIDCGAFFRWFFDTYGSISIYTVLNTKLRCDIKLSEYSNFCEKLRDKFQDLLKIKCNVSKTHISLEGCNAMDFLHFIYNNSDARYRDIIKYNRYLEWMTFGLGIDNIPTCKFFKNEKDAVTPFK